MFARIARRYDLLNTVMTAGRHHAWRSMATDVAISNVSGAALDVATGTGDFAFALARRPAVSHVVGLDYTPEMLTVADAKARLNGLASRLSLVAGDARALPFPDDHFECATVGFGVRNFTDVPRALREMARVVRPGGQVVVLEIVQLEDGGPLARLFPIYFRYIVPLMGAVLAGDRESYAYLPDSVEVFLTAGRLVSLMEEAGLTDVTHRKLALGIVAVLAGTKA
jgi:demethylmenaquinone methyltransferase/2-methoxy-6-polyprenyl-1,4-benzoquinol methylase